MIIPVILESDLQEIKKKLAIISEVAEQIQIDVLDGTLVPTKTFLNIGTIDKLVSKSQLEIHLMTKNPCLYLKDKLSHVKAVCAQVEAYDKIHDFVKIARAHGYETGISVLENTPLENIEPWINKVDYVQFMTIKAGVQGNPLLPHVLEKIKTFRIKYPQITVQSDGGAKLENISQLRDAGVTNVVVGTGIFRTANPIETYKKFTYLLN
ncbi:hypothetical protein A3K34_00250 [candidate division WWE3 bacterium RIFOXYC1_FULL_40_10]|uniref:Ribulose-phosphate 3-epimerase n=1 Tax=candidate division WWE3 bacterium RIFOXYA2_FULL_46_9 TaxID=1802636 RepID=A0A1F4W1E5_UNCKA|nr:MAG: hypothetical protein A3K58_00250 [candidate division WWE3 bacterium RIFOXYB1_FULL_40_22]OGC61324.1 MAG: hypothetical protein A3K37_00250 [candidate division WWE3 bacterium RIFOXYA1_FULL_40_11]OGC63234.1 MAG: hypothetical protein A2264_00905 [candidate division WWE3 bacterium RIFOXYA2_FULL_46_9]OGC65314.1 MAG: hypothetical protein A2326_04535 [candidate division WWE3 bacterium RIFOXYB2_FULL_41_6]OGC65707.1 MAG: hypothetical protein A3K34_00250 [candidate division WWE3 bacterium RIFOXYC1_